MAIKGFLVLATVFALAFGSGTAAADCAAPADTAFATHSGAYVTIDGSVFFESNGHAGLQRSAGPCWAADHTPGEHIASLVP